MKVMDEQELWAAWKQRGDVSARDELIVRNMRIVKYIAGRMAIHVPPNIEMDDLIGWGVLGLMDAVEKYDRHHATKFSTYASIRIRGAIVDEIRSLDWAPRSLRAMARKVGAAREKLRHDKGREPSASEIAEFLGADPGQIEDTIAQLQVAQMQYLDDFLPSEDGREGRRLDMVSDPSRSPEEAAREQEKRERIAAAILKLPEQQQKVLNLYYYEELTLKEIGLALEVSESRVCQIHGAAMKSLRKAVQGEGE